DSDGLTASTTTHFTSGENRPHGWWSGTRKDPPNGRPTQSETTISRFRAWGRPPTDPLGPMGASGPADARAWAPTRPAAPRTVLRPNLYGAPPLCPRLCPSIVLLHCDSRAGLF